jgi:uroporphyrin-III C-methyltransferase
MDRSPGFPRHPSDAGRSPGRVTLVGAGPGGADLITVRGARALGRADVVVHDQLVDPEVLDLAPCTAERLCVGKTKGGGFGQDEINRILIEHASRGANVVRLKGGDPFVFGRGGEEVDEVRAAGLEVEVVPGLSSALAGPALAGVPVTHRGEAASVLIISGHRVGPTDYDWQAVARAADTIVVLMAATTATVVADRLLRAGRPAGDPVAVVHRAGRADQLVTTFDLAALAGRSSPLASPCVVAIGTVAARARQAALAHQLDGPGCEPPG